MDGAFGLGALVLGFATQAVAYAVTLRRDEVNEGSLARAATAIALAALVGAALLVLWRVVRMRLIKRQVVMERPYERLLVDYGEELGFPLERETAHEYAERVFGVTDVEPGGPKAEETPRAQDREES